MLSEPSPPPLALSLPLPLPLPLPLLPLSTICLLYANGLVQDETAYFNAQPGADSPRPLLLKDLDGGAYLDAGIGVDGGGGGSGEPWTESAAQSTMPASPSLHGHSGSGGDGGALAVDDTWSGALDLTSMDNFPGPYPTSCDDPAAGVQGLYTHGLQTASTAAITVDGLSTPPSDWLGAVTTGNHAASLYPAHESFGAPVAPGTLQQHLQQHLQQQQQQQQQHQPMFENPAKSWLSSNGLDTYLFPQTLFHHASEPNVISAAAVAPTSSLRTPSPPHRQHFSSGASRADVSDASDAPFASPSSSSAVLSSSSSSSSSSESSYREMSAGSQRPATCEIVLRRSSRTRLPSLALGATTLPQGTQQVEPFSQMTASGAGTASTGNDPVPPASRPRRRRGSARIQRRRQQQQQQQQQQQREQSLSPLDADSAAAAAAAPWPPGERPPGAPYQYVNQMDPESLEFFERTLLEDRDESLRAKVPFKTIQHKLRHIFSGAQETLRGHHRRLVKEPAQRVRKPVWHDVDIQLLQRAVASPRCKFPNGKTSWRAVSQYISERGGTYDFGITTCSRKWNELSGGE
ncbi:flavin-binding monooxygenase-like protein [Purpureocillium lavendulum]|uniref:Flavin-binding monooxygenase-like protein n=1 Tax=Purpureocillium lavendulum TaxID=1247861 RepID=A0AB34G4Y9_9HYPO|nr:flavin-binding monooxygenase-like protein [Purpureocillium lavendulum]